MKFEILADCSTTSVRSPPPSPLSGSCASELTRSCPLTSDSKARVSRMTLAHGPTILPTFMPVATQASMKSLTPTQTAGCGITLQLNNAYHLLLRPGMEVLDKAGGAHKFQGWKGNMLTVSLALRGRRSRQTGQGERRRRRKVRAHTNPPCGRSFLSGQRRVRSPPQIISRLAYMYQG